MPSSRAPRSVNPEAELRSIWVNSWYDPGKERQAAITLISQGADMVTHHTDSTAVVQAAEEEGVYAFGYHSDMSIVWPQGTPDCDYTPLGDYYVQTIKDVRAGTWAPVSVWGGYPRGMIELAPLNEVIPEALQNRISTMESQLRERTLHPFAGPVVDQSGAIIVPEGKNMTDDELNKMNYYLKGVVSTIPN